MKNIAELEKDIHTYDKESQEFIESLKFVDREIAELNAMKSTAGWKLLEKKIREELHARILKVIEADIQVVTLIKMLNVTDTNSISTALAEEIERILPQ